MLVVAMLSATLPHCYGGKIVVVSTSGKDNSTACLSGVGKCSNLSMALEGVTNDTTVTIERGTYTLRHSAHHKFDYVKNVNISGQAPASEVMVNCSDGAGLAFHHATTVHISNVSFYGCGYEQLSNSRVSKSNNFAKYNVSLFFQLCKDVTLNQVNVSYSKGIAVQFFATIGNNEISSCNFMNNTGGQTVGGGLYIEFPYCLPGNDYCEDTSNVPGELRTGGTFSILNSNFYYNEAKNESRVFMVPHLSDHVSFGRGGGLSVFFKGNSSLSSIFVIHCHFIGNQAVYGGGAFVELQDSCYNNKVLFELCSFDSNQATQQGGGLRVNFSPSISSKGPQVSDMHHNNISIFINAFVNNEAHTSGGGMFFGATRENSSSPTNKLTIEYGKWNGNIAPIGSAISMIGWHEVTHDGAIIAPVLEQCSFDSNRPPSIDHSIRDEQSVGKGTVYLDSIPIQFSASAVFTNNRHTAIAGANTGIHFKNSANYKFVNNSARQGGAIALLGNAFFVLDQVTTMEFINNTAYYLGGAIYATSLTGQDSISSGNCFIRYYDLMKDPYKWDVNFRFINNTAMGKPNAIYTSSPQPCLWGRAFGPPHDDQNDMSAVFCWNNASLSKKKWDYGNNECGDEIMSAPSKFGINNKPTVEISLNNVIPGRWNNFNLTILDDFGRDVSNYTVFAAQSLSPYVILSDHSHYLAHNSILLHQLNRDVKSGTVALQTVNTPNPIMATLNVTFMECPPGFKLIQGQCTCVANDYDNKLVCDTNAVPVHSDIVRGYWIGHSPFDNMTVVMALCRFCFHENNTVSVESFHDVQHKLCHTVNRNGTLCSKCIDGYCFAVNSESYDCINYDENFSLPFRILSFILYKFLFPLVFLWFVYRFGIKIASGKYNAPVFFAQMVTTVVPMDLDGALWYPQALKKFYYMLYDMLNLELRLPDYSRFCIHPDMSITFVIALNYCVALLPLVLVIAMAIVYRCHDMRNTVWCCYFDDDQNQDSHHSRTGCKKVLYYFNRVLFSSNRDFLISGVAAFFVLSYMKIAVTTCMLISPNTLINGDGYVLYMDGTKRYPDDIIQYLALALIFCVYLFMVPFSLLILRYGKQGSEGFLHYLLKGLQANFRSLPLGEQSQRNLTCCKGRVKNRNVHQTGMWRTATFNTETELCSVDFKCCFGSSCFSSCGVYDFRWVSGAYFVLRILMVLCYLLLQHDIQLLSQMLICCAAAAFFIVFQPYGYNHTEKDEQQQASLQQELDDTVQGSTSVNLASSPSSPSKKYNRLDAAVFLALAMVIAISIYRSYLTNIDSTASIPALTLQSVLLLLPAAWFGFHMLSDLKKRLSGLRKWVTDARQRRRRDGNIYEPVPIDDEIEENDHQKEDDQSEDDDQNFD